MMRFILLSFVIIISTFELHSGTKPYEFNDVGISNTINSSITTDIVLTDEYNKPVNLKDLINNKPTLVNFVYLNCPLLCHLLLDGITDVSQRSHYTPAQDYQILSISIDPNESNDNLKAYKKKYLDQINQPNGWLFLKGSKKQIKEITEIFGYNFNYIKRTKDYAHPSAIYFYNKKITNYIEGVTFDVKLFNYSLMSSKPVKTLKEKIITYCYYFDPDNQTYSFLIFKILRILCLITVLILSIIIIYCIRRERKLNTYGIH